MNREKIRKISIIMIIAVYCLSMLLNDLQFFKLDVHAEEPVKNSNLVAVFVDSRFNDGNINWYATNYIQKNMPDTKALVFPINKDKFKAYDIAKMLDNIYKEGQSDNASKLVGTVLVGDLPLPVVKKNDYIFPSVYPYVDFVDKKFSYNTNTGFFEYSGTNAGSPEIWHSIINFGDDQKKYEDYFHKLKKYDDNPSNFADSNFWYEDFIALGKTFNTDNLGYYINNSLFLEDISYHRYSNLLYRLLNGNYTDSLLEAAKNFNQTLTDLKNQNTIISQATTGVVRNGFNDISNQYFSQAQDFSSNYMNGFLELESSTDSGTGYSDDVPTKLLPQVFEGFIKTYNNIFGQTYQTDMVDNSVAGGRREGDELDSHIKKILIKDELLKKTMVNYNNALESALDKKIQKERYDLDVIVPYLYQDRQIGQCRSGSSTSTSTSTDSDSSSCYRFLSGEYENFYFGKRALDLTGSEGLSIYKGTYKNFVNTSSLSGYTFDVSDFDDVGVGINLRTVGGSYAIQDRQIMANRGLNYEKAKSDTALYMATKCSDSESNEDWAYRFFGGASILNMKANLNSGRIDLKGFDAASTWNPSYNTIIGGSIYDIAGTKLSNQNSSSVQTFRGYYDYANIVKTKEGYVDPDSCNVSQTNIDYCGSHAKSHKNISDMDFWNVAKQSSGKLVFTGADRFLIKETSCSNPLGGGGTLGGSEDESETMCCEDGYVLKYYYRFLDSKIKNTNPTPAQISGMNMTTRERPIDSVRFVSFQGIGGDSMKFVYPDLFNVEVYKKDGNNLKLKSVDEIKQAIKDYLKLKVDKYNDALSSEESKKTAFYSVNQTAIDRIKDTRLDYNIPSRSYSKIDRDFFEKILGDENIERVAYLLYYANSGELVRKHYSNNVLDDLNGIRKDFDINTKIRFILNQYLKTTSSSDALVNPYFNKKAYEAGYINSNGNDALGDNSFKFVPEIIQQIQSSQDSVSTSTSSNLPDLLSSMDSSSDDNECGVDSDGSVIIWQWPSALSCRLSKTLSNPVSLTIDNSCQQNCNSSLMDMLGIGDSSSSSSSSLNSSIAPISTSSTGSALSGYYSANDNTRMQYSEFVSSYGADKRDDYISNRYAYINTSSKVNENNLLNMSQEEQNKYYEISQNMNISVSPSNSINLDDYNDDDNKNYGIKIGSSKDLGSLDIQIAAIGNNCIILEGQNICRQNYDLKVNPYVNENFLKLALNGNKSGTTLLQFKICKSGICHFTEQSLNVVPGKISNLRIISPTNKVLKGGLLPFQVSGQDKYGNSVGEIYQTYKISADYGNLKFKDDLVKEYEFNRFTDSYFIYDSSDLSGTNGDVSATIKVEPLQEFEDLDNTLPTASAKFDLVDGNLTVKSGGKQITNISYQLPNSLDDIYYSDSNGNRQLNPSKIIKLDLDLKAADGTPLNSIVSVSTENGTLVPGAIVENTVGTLKNGVTKQYKVKAFEYQSDFILSGGNLEFYLHPSFIAGKDSLILKVKGLNDLVIPMEVLPSDPVGVKILSAKDKIKVGEEQTYTINVKDIWGNIVYNKDTNIIVGTEGKLSIDGGDVIKATATGGVAKATVKGEDPGGKGYIYAYLAGKSIKDQIADYKSVVVKNILWPTENMNAMYLSLFGSDWGNMRGYFSDNNKLAQNMISASDRLLAVTTQIVDLESVKKTQYLVNSNLKIQNFDDITSSLIFEDSSIKIKLGTSPKILGKIKIGALGDFTVEKSDSYPSSVDGNRIVYIAQPLDDNITSNIFEDNKIKINNKVIVNFSAGIIDSNTQITLSDNVENGYNVWDITYSGKSVGELVMARNDDFLTSNMDTNLENNSDYIGMVVFGEGTTNGVKGIGLFDGNSSLSEEEKSYDSIEDSSDGDKNIGFRANFKNITNFANGENVGDATKPFASEYLINFGDPIVKRVDKSKEKDHTDYEGGLGKVLFSDPNNQILKAVDLDFNDDGYMDLAVGYSDGRIKLLKNYGGGDDSFTDLGDVLYIADGIKGLRGGDADGDGYYDLFVQDGKGKLRVYKNKKGIFDPDGTLVCLDIPNGSDGVSGAYQIFVKDMDMDGKADIVTNDSDGDIKIFYGNTYLSNNKYVCDDEYSSRLKQKLIQNFSANLKEDRKVYDNSLVYRPGMTKIEAGPNDYNDPMGFSGNLYELSGVGDSQLSGLNFNMQTYADFVNLTTKEQARYQQMPSEYLPSYMGGIYFSSQDSGSILNQETQADTGNLYYSKILYIDTGENVEIYKKFVSESGSTTLKAGDQINVEIYFKANRTTKFTYIDELNGPWTILRGEDDSIAGFDSDFSGDSTVTRNVGNGYQFMLDNATIQAGEIKKITYPLVYNGGEAVVIDLEKINNDKYTDIKAYPSDACFKGYWAAIAIDNGKDYNKGFVSLKEKYEDHISNTWDAFDESTENITNINSQAVTGSDLTSLQNSNVLNLESWNDSNGFVDFNGNVDVSSASISLDVDLGGNMTEIKSLVSKIQNALCNGIKFDYGNCSGGIPVPFNMAFFAPGMFNIFGCGLSLDPGLPIFYYPSTIYTPEPVPVPNLLTVPGIDGFISPKGGVYPSMIRIYLAPTLTQKLGIVMCFGNYTLGMTNPIVPFGTIAGNCIVMAAEVPLPSSCGNKKSAGNDYDYTINSRQDDLNNIGTCQKDLTVKNKNTSPFVLDAEGRTVSTDKTYNTTEDAFKFDDVSINLNDFNFFGQSTSTVKSSLLSTNRSKINIKSVIDQINSNGGGLLDITKNISLKIQGGSVKGLVKCIIRKWLDNQIRYIINNLTNMTIYLYLPDLTTITDGFTNLNWKKFGDKFKKLQESWSNMKKTIFSMANNVGSTPEGGTKTEKAKEFLKSMTPSKAGLKRLSDALTNPFEVIASFFDDVPLIKIRQKSLILNVPFIYSEDIERYYQYLTLWKDRNMRVIDKFIDEKNKECLNIKDSASRQTCLDQLSNMVNLKINKSKLVSSISQNLKRLDEYKKFPMKLYNYLHVIDKVLSELSCSVRKLVDSTIGWLKQNAKRFEKWVDLIITLISIIDTWQILIDFSVNWKVKCGKCRQDNYDFYSCVLSLLCIELPVLPIPPFKIPDIYIDLSHIDLGVDIILPDVKIRPQSINLPKLPELGDINLSVGLPSIPVLPALPDLPEIPGIIPAFNLKLPMLPPAPRIPQILPAIKAILKIADWIGSIYCIIKGNIGLVAEWNTKSRVEQLTQRTSRIFPMDFMDLITSKPAIAGKDLRLDMSLRLKFEFSQFYDFLNGIASSLNQTTNQVRNDANKFTKLDIQGVNGINKVDVNIDTDKLFNYRIQEYEKNLNGSGYEIKDAAAILKSGLEMLYETDTEASRKNKEKQIISFMEESADVKPNYKGLDSVKDQTDEYFTNQRQKYQDLAEKVKNDYDGLLKELSQSQLADEKSDEINISTKLFEGNSKIVDRMKISENPSKTYISMNKNLISGFKKSLNSHTAEDLNMTSEVYKNAQDYISDIESKTDTALAYVENQSSPKLQDTQMKKVDVASNFKVSELAVNTGTSLNIDQNIASNTIDKNLLIADVITGTSSSSGSIDVLRNYVDMTQYIKGFYAKGDDGYYRNVINRYDKGSDAYKGKQYEFTDLNKDGGDDILRRDSNNIYVKYSHQNDTYDISNHVIYKDFYEMPTFDSPSDIRKYVDDQGFIKIKGSKYKIRDRLDSIDGFERAGQTDENISFAWNSRDGADAYVLRFTQRVDAFHDGGKEFDFLDDSVLNKKYVLIVPSDFDESAIKIKVDEINKKFAYDLKQDGTVLEIYKTDFDKSRFVYTISSLGKKVYYAQIAPLSKSSSNDKLYQKTAPWSNQATNSQQIWADDQSPTLEASLIREKTGKEISKGTSLRGYINTNYDLNINWSDNGMVVKNRVMKDGIVLQENSGAQAVISDLFFTGVQSLSYTLVAKDFAGNTQSQSVNLEISIPTISINNLDMGTGGTSVSAQMSESMDEGTLKIQRDRYGYREFITGNNDNSSFDINPQSNIVTGGIFDNSDNIVLKDAGGKNIGIINSDDGKINLYDDYKDKIEFKLDFNKKVPIINIMKNGESMFSVYYKAESFDLNSDINILNGSYEAVGLTGNVSDEFSGGLCLKKKTLDSCSFYVSANGNIYVPEQFVSDYRGKYDFMDLDKKVVYDIYDNNGNDIFKLKFKMEPFKK